MRFRNLSLKKIAPIVLRELSLALLWALSAPHIDNYIALEGITQPIWYTGFCLGHLFRLLVLLGVFRTPSFLRWVYRLAGIPMAALWGSILLGEMRIINPYYPYALTFMGLFIGALHLIRRLHGVVANAVLLIPLALSLYYQFFTLAMAYVGLYALFASGGILFGRNIYRPPAWVVSLAFVNLLVPLLLFHFRFATGNYLERVSKHPAVERLFVYDNADPVGRMIGKNIMILREICDPDHYIISSHHGGEGLVLVDRKNNVARTHPLIKEGSNDILADCSTYEAIVGKFGAPGGLYFIDVKNWPNQTRPAIPIPGKIVYFVFDAVKSVFLVYPEDQILYAVDAETGKITGSLPGPDERAYDPKAHELTAVTEPDFSIMRLKITGGEDRPFQVIKRRSLEIPIYKRLQTYLHPGPVEGTTLLTSLWEGTVTLYDKDLKPVRRTRIAPGISAMALTHDKKHLFIGGYGDGKLYIMNMDKWKIVSSLYLGHRMRELRLSEDGRFIYLGTSQGGFRIDVQRVLAQPSGNPN